MRGETRWWWGGWSGGDCVVGVVVGVVWLLEVFFFQGEGG